MIIDFTKIEAEILPNFKGGEKQTVMQMFTDPLNRILRGKLVPGATIGMHAHDTSSEIIFIQQGAGKVLTSGGEEFVRAGMCHYCPKGESHSLINSGDEELIFLAVVPQQ